MTNIYQRMSTEELLTHKARLSKELSAPDDKTNPEAFVDPGRTKVQTGSKDSLDTDSAEGSVYDTVTKPKEEKTMSTRVSKEEATEMIPMGGKPVGSKPSTAVGPKAEEHDVPSVARASIPQGGGVEPAIKPPKLKEEECPPGMKEEEDDDEEIKALKSKLRATWKAKRGAAAAKPMGRFNTLAEEYRSKQEETSKVRMKLEAARTKLEEEMGQVQSALSGQAPQEEDDEAQDLGTSAASTSAGTPPAGVGAPGASSDQTMPLSEEGQLHGSSPMQAPSPAGQTVRTPSFLSEEDDDDETRKALKAKGRELLTAYKAVVDAIGQAGDTAGASPDPKVTGGIPQPAAKIPAQPGKSGSSGVYREEKGAKPDLDLESASVNSEDSGGNPKKLIQNAKGTDPKDVSGVYPKPTEIMSGVGYTGEPVGKSKETKIEKISDLHPTSKELGRDKYLPTLKFMVSEHVPTVDEVVELAKKGELMVELTKEYHATTEKTLPEGQESLLRKGLRQVFS